MTLVGPVVVLLVLFVTLAALLLVAEQWLVHYGACTIDVNGGERVLAGEGGETLLSQLYRHRIYIPSACGGRGTCGACKVRVESGAGPLLPTEEAFLTRGELRQGLRLACQVKLRGDVAIRLPDEWLHVRMFTSVVQRVTELTPDTRELRLRLLEPERMDHLPGQYIQIMAPGPEGPVFRAYSISSPPSAKEYVDLIVKRVPGGLCSTWLHRLAVGDTVRFTGAYGDFRLNEDPRVEVVCVAGGCGIAPVRSIVHDLYQRWPDRRCRLFFGCKTAQDLYCLEEFRHLAALHPAFTFVAALSEPGAADSGWTGETGFIHLVVDRRLEPGPRRQAFVCGPPPMNEAVARVLQAKGVRGSHIFVDNFYLQPVDTGP